MGHHSFLRIGRSCFFFARDGYSSDLAALFTEVDRHQNAAGVETNWDDFGYGYRATALQMRQRLQLRGFTAASARADLEGAVAKWHEDPDPELGPPCTADELIDGYRKVLTSEDELGSFHERHDLLWHLDHRSLLRLLLDLVPEETLIMLDLSELTGCCVELSPRNTIAKQARDAQLQSVSDNAPLIVLTEGSADSRLLSMAMEITHPHLIGFINFIDFGRAPAEPSASALARTAYSFIAAGVANRFVAIADNDAAAHTALDKIKKDKALPDTCRIRHYPDLDLLRNYPTLGPYSQTTMLADVNGRAGALEMYLGRDVLTIDGELAPVEWNNYEHKVGKYHGVLSKQDKQRVQAAFEAKVESARQQLDTSAMDWSGVHAIIETIVHAFD
ncbi:HEPN/Toprim-associated domain-containing protein [Actinoallomurus iriomotensis]|nr:HEPN/Toprim-associated domain-containing protein [Actinoallomurus iriomotensis]